tara:strand:+ start:2132 stop:2314 length:183 start_codon:yes stop_codon:yes gene_type:complete
MPMFENMSSDRMMACRIFDGEIHRIKSLFDQSHEDWPQYSMVIKYLEMRIKSMEERQYYR